MKVGDIIQSKNSPQLIFLITNIQKSGVYFGTITYTLYSFINGREHMVENTLNHDRIVLKYQKVS